MKHWVFGIVLLSAATGMLALALGACSVKIDASVLDDAGADVFAPSVVECATVKDCHSDDPCVAPRCDDATQKCVFDVCPSGDKCSAITCTTANKCGRVAPITFNAGTFPIPEGLACPSCAGAVYPYLFVASNVRLHAFRLTDPGNLSPKELPIPDLGFTPKTVLTSGRRVYFVGGPSGASTSPYKLQVAWVDVPADVGVPSLRAHVSSFPFPSPDFRFDGAIAGVDDQLFALRRVVTYENNANVIRNQELLMHVSDSDPGQLNFIAPKGYPANGQTVAFSNGRLVVYRAEKGVGTFNFGTQPGTADATTSPDAALPTMGTPGSSTFADSDDGSVYWASTLRLPPVQNQPQMLSGVRLGVALVAGGGAFNLASKVDLETYAGMGVQENDGQQNPNPFVGPVIPIGNGSLVALAAARENTGETSVQMLTNVNGALTIAPGKRLLMKARVDQIAATGTPGFAYVVTPDTADTMTVHIFSSECP
jgi:hypothetical protein